MYSGKNTSVRYLKFLSRLDFKDVQGQMDYRRVGMLCVGCGRDRDDSRGISEWVPPWWFPPRSPGGGSHSQKPAASLTKRPERESWTKHNIQYATDILSRRFIQASGMSPFEKNIYQPHICPFMGMRTPRGKKKRTKRSQPTVTWVTCTEREGFFCHASMTWRIPLIISRREAKQLTPLLSATDIWLGSCAMG